MNISKCKTCKHYEPFFSSCNLYCETIYIGEGEFEERPVSIRVINVKECNYRQKASKEL